MQSATLWTKASGSRCDGSRYRGNGLLAVIFAAIRGTTKVGKIINTMWISSLTGGYSWARSCHTPVFCLLCTPVFYVSVFKSLWVKKPIPNDFIVRSSYIDLYTSSDTNRNTEALNKHWIKCSVPHSSFLDKVSTLSWSGLAYSAVLKLTPVGLRER